MADSFVISSAWLTGIKDALGKVRSSGEAASAIQSGLDFASMAADAIRSGGSWFSPDPWRTSAASDIDQAAIQLDKERQAYDEDGTQAIDLAAWSKASQKTLYVYALAQVARKGYPADTDTSDIESSMLGAAGQILSDIANAPKAVINYAADLANTAVDAVGSVGKHMVKAAGGIVQEAASQVKDAAETLIPWTPILVAVAIAGGAVLLLIYASKTGTLKQVAALKPV